jgi:anaerobic ribonucleoside-triphosphate reductase activating protein
MNFYGINVSFQEVPLEVSLVISITGCPIHCRGCHSSELWDPNQGQILTLKKIQAYLEKYKGLLTCVCFLGGEWHHEDLKKYLRLFQRKGLKTALYSGNTSIAEDIKEHLDYLKTGPWIESKGGLSKPDTNQRMIKIDTNECLNHYFWKFRP